MSVDRTTFVLGAGFSRAVHPNMPLMKDLYTDKFEHLVKDAIGWIPGDVEETLAYAYDPPAYLSDADRLRAKALYLDLVDEIDAELARSERDATSEPPPPWLVQLTQLWHQNQCHVLTFNYDTLVERCAIRNADPDGDEIDPIAIYVAPVPPEKSRYGYGLVAPTAPATFRLIKLHGSRSWSWHSDGSQDDVVYSRKIKRWPGLSVPERDGLDKGSVGLSTAIVPPVGAKDAFMSRDILRSQWRAAADAPNERVVVLGYSLPEPDRLSRMLFRDRFARSEIVIADLCESAAIRSCRRFADRPDRVTIRSGQDCVEGVVEMLGEE